MCAGHSLDPTLSTLKAPFDWVMALQLNWICFKACNGELLVQVMLAWDASRLEAGHRRPRVGPTLTGVKNSPH